MKRNRTILLAAAALLAAFAFAMPHPHADIRVLTHNPADLAPQRAQAVIDVGLASVSVLVTWSKHLGY